MDIPKEQACEISLPIANPDSLSDKPEKVSTPTWVAGCDVCGTGTGFIDLTPDPNTQGPWLFMWSTGEFTEDISGITAGVYQVTIFDANFQLQIAQIVVQSCPFIGPISITGAITGNTLCNGTSNGAIDLTVDPVPNQWNYFWSNGETTEDLTNVDPGVYTVSVTWGVTCTTEETFIVPNLTAAPNLSPPIGGFGLDFCNTGNGTAAVFVTGGTQPYTYEWSNGETDLSIANLVAGEYTVTVTGADGCSATLMGTVNPGTLPVNVDLNVITYNTTCNGANGSISITVTPPGVWLPSATFLWSNGATTQNISNLPSGSYRVTVTRLGTCTATDVWFIENEPLFPQLSFAITAATCGNSNGSVNLTTLPGGVPPYTFAWSNGSTTEDLSNILPGMYEVTMTSANGCTSTGSATVDDTPATYSYSALVTDQTSCDTINGRISLSLFPANLAYTWSNGATTTNLYPVAPGDYTVTISAGGTCTSVETITVADVRAYPSIPGMIDTTTCGLANGGVDLFIFGNPVAPLTYLWSTGDTSQDLTGVQADTFFVTVTSATGCSNQNSFIIPNVNDTIRVQGTFADNISCATPTGFIALDVTPLDTAYTFLWSNGITNDSLLNIVGGDYLVTVTLGVSCIALDTFTIVNTALPPNLSSTGTSTNCDFSNGTVDLSVSGGAGPFTFLWSNAATTEDLSALPPGTYTVTVTGVNSCTAVSAATVLNNNIALSVSGTPSGNSSCAAPNGSLDINVTPAGTYNYIWSNTATTEDLSNLPVGTYTVTVSLGTCLSSSTFSILDNALSPNLAASGSPASCDFSNGAADLSVSGGAGPFTFLWSNMATTEDLVNLPPGSYTVTVTGANACTAISTANVPNNNIALNLSGTAQGNSSCTVSDGSLDLNVAPAGAYTYLWSNAATTEDLSGLNSGTYTVTVSLGTCQSSSTFSVADNTATPALSTNITASICGVNNGGIDLSVSGPAGPYNFLWSNTATTEDITSLLPGNFSVTVTAANGCTESAMLNVPNNASNFSLTAAPVPLTNCAVNNGSIDLNITPAGTYTYVWSNTATTEDLSGLAPGTYTVSVTESGSCTATASYFVIDQRIDPIATQTLVPELCGQADGSIDLNVSGGTAPFGYLWATGQMSEDLNNLSAGTYTVTVTDVNNCTVTSSAVVPGNSITFSLAGLPAPNSSCIQNDGAIDLTVNPPGGVTYLWSNMATTEDLTALPAGTYTVTVSAGGNCTNTADFTIASNVPTPLLSQAIAPATCGANNGSIDLSVSGSPAPYQFFWSNAATDEDLNTVVSGTYSVTVTASNGCSTVDNFTVPENSFSPAIASQLTSASSCLINNGAIDLTISPAMAYTYTWSGGQTDEDLIDLSAGTYTVTVSAGGACTSTAELMVPSDVPLPAISDNIADATCGQASGSIDLTVTGSVGPYQFFWSNAATTEDLTNTVSGAFTVTVTAANGCSTVGNFTIPENTIIPQVAGAVTIATSCTANNGAIDLTVGPSTGYLFIWSNAATTEDLANIAAGTYTVTVSGGGACNNTASYTVGSNVPAPALSDNIAAATCGQASGSIDLTISGSVGPYQFFWSNAATTEDLTNTVSGAFTVTVTAANGCTTVGNFSIPENTIVPQVAGAVTASTSCTSNNGAIDLTLSPPPAGGYLFAWSNAATTEDLTNLAAGTYTITVNGGGACTNTASFVVTSNAPSPTLTDNIAGATCGQSNGSIDLSVGGSPTPYQYFWSNAATTEDLANIASGQFTVTVTAANGCSTVGSFTVPENGITPVVNGSATADNSCSADNGAVDLTIGSGTNYTFTWSNAATTEDLVNVPPGSYTVTVNGGGACTTTASFTVADQTTQPQASITAGTTVLDCSTSSTTLTGSVTGTPNAASFLWSSNGTPLGSNSSLNVTAPGQYDLVVQDNVTSCTATSSIIVTQNLNPPALTVATPGALTCTTLSQTLTGSSTVSGVQFAWATIIGTDTTILGTGATVSVSTAGTYYLIGTNPANNCANATSVTVIADLAPPTAEAGAAFTLDCAGETAGLNGSGSGAPNLAFEWTSTDGHFVSGATTATPLIDEAGTYQLLVTNPANGCTDTDEVVIEPEVPVAFASVQQPSCQELLGTVQVDSVTGLSAPILYSLNNGQPGAQNQFANLAPGTYTIEVSGGNGCSASTVVEVEAPDLVQITLVPTAEIGLGENYQINATLNIPASDIASILWTPSVGLECDTCLSTLAMPSSTTDYQLLVVSNNGCEARGNLLLTVNKARQIFAPNVFNPDDDGTNDVFTIFANPVIVDRIKSLQVYSRWGEQVFERNDFAPGDTNLGWDGTFKGEKLNPAVFIWQAVVLFVDGKEEVFTGDVTIQR